MYKYYDKDGVVTESLEADSTLKKNSYCFMFETEEEPGTPHLYIKTANGEYCDPYGEKPRTKMFDRSKFVHASELAFNLYVKFLQSKHNYLLLNARRAK